MGSKAVSFLPWLGLEESIKIGPIEFWPYYKKRDDKIEDERVKTRLETFFNQYLDNSGSPVKTITIVSYEGKEFEPLMEEEQQTIKNALYALAFSCMVPFVVDGVANDQRGLPPPSSNTFEMRTIKFSTESNDNYWEIRAGSISMASQIREIYFYSPLEKGGEIYNEDKCLRFLELFRFLFTETTGELEDFKNRLFQSLYWFFMAHIEGWYVTEPSKIVMMATAFESFLNLHEGRPKRRGLMEEIEKRVANEYEYIEEERLINIDNRERICRKRICWWANDFYNLRSKIVHGDRIVSEDLVYKEWITHLIAADLVFSHMVILDLFDKENPINGLSEEERLRRAINRRCLSWVHKNAYLRLGWIKNDSLC